MVIRKMLKVIRIIWLLVGALFTSINTNAQSFDKVVDENNIDFNWNKQEREAWFNTMGLGMFVHFGVDAPLGIVISHSLVGASKEYLDRYFHELPKYFDPYNFNPKVLARTAKLAGMKYVVFTTKHHSGFCLWNTKTTAFNVMNTPYGKDMVKAYVDAVRNEGLGVGFYFSPEDFHFLYENNQPINRFFDDWTPALKKSFDDLTRRQCEELMTNYGKIDLLFIDGEPKDIVKKTCWKLQPDIVITRGAMKTPEQYLPGEKMKQPWLSCMTLSKSWQFQPTNNQFKTGNDLIRLAVETRSKGGSLLINIGPKQDGSLSSEEAGPLAELSAWYFANHECLDTVKSWFENKEGEVWYTMSSDSSSLYAVIMDVKGWKEGARYTKILHAVKGTSSSSIEILGQNGVDIEYKQHVDVAPHLRILDDGIELSLVRTQRFYDDHSWSNPIVVKIKNAHYIGTK